MKRIISMLVLAVMVFSVLPLALYGCEENDTEQDRSVAETSSKAEESSESEESKTVINIKDNPEYTNVALNKTYRSNTAHESYPDEGNVTLTDGTITPVGAQYSDATFVGFHKNSDYYKSNSYAHITVDLGDIYLLDKFVAHLGTKYYSSVGIGAPEFVRIYLSNDGKNWHKTGLTVHKDTDESNVVASTLELEEALTARYVQYRVVGGESNWMFVCEVEAFGIKADGAIPYPETEKATNMLFVGNSSTYYFNVPNKLMLMAESVGIEINVTYFQTGGAYLSQFADANDAARGQLLRDTLEKNDYDIIVLQDNSNADYDDTKAAMDVLMPLLKNAEPNAEIMLYERYSSNTDPAQRPISGKRLHNAYTQVAKDFGIEKNAHVSDAFLLCYEKYPSIELHYTDNSHHSDVGAYLIASVMAIEYLGIDLDDVTYTGGNDEETVKALKEIARLAVESGYDFK